MTRIRNTPLYPLVTEDKHSWRVENNNEYSVKSVYRPCVQELISTSPRVGGVSGV